MDNITFQFSAEQMILWILTSEGPKDHVDDFVVAGPFFSRDHPHCKHLQIQIPGICEKDLCLSRHPCWRAWQVSQPGFLRCYAPASHMRAAERQVDTRPEEQILETWGSNFGRVFRNILSQIK